MRDGQKCIAGVENAGLENAGPICRGGKLRDNRVWKACLQISVPKLMLECTDGIFVDQLAFKIVSESHGLVDRAHCTSRHGGHVRWLKSCFWIWILPTTWLSSQRCCRC